MYDLRIQRLKMEFDRPFVKKIMHQLLKVHDRVLCNSRRKSSTDYKSDVFTTWLVFCFT